MTRLEQVYNALHTAGYPVSKRSDGQQRTIVELHVGPDVVQMFFDGAGEANGLRVLPQGTLTDQDKLEKLLKDFGIKFFGFDVGDNKLHFFRPDNFTFVFFVFGASGEFLEVQTIRDHDGLPTGQGTPLGQLP